MTRYVALLRGVNVGGAKRVPMVEWREMLGALGFGAVQTLLNSGNAVFEAPSGTSAAHAARIQAAILESLGLEVPVIVKSAREFAAIVADNTLAAIADNPSRLIVAFTAQADALSEMAALSGLVVPPEQLHIGKHALYFWCPAGLLQSQIGAALLGKPGRAATTRNWATVSKIAALLPALGAERHRAVSSGFDDGH